MKTLEAHEQSLSKIFSSDYVFEIPGYQRPYSWTTEQAGELLSDLLDFMAANAGNLKTMPPYFLGSIVLIKESISPRAKVVDGQQRLTTLTLLLAAIRYQLNEGEDQDEISDLLFEKGNRIRQTENRYRLTLREKDQVFFREHVQDGNGFARLIGNKSKLTDSQARLQENAVLFNGRLAALSREEKLSLVEFIVNCCYLVAVSTPDLDSAFRIFNVLNSRGLDLSATDILKSKITGSIPDAAARDAYTGRWEDLEEALGRQAFGELFSHIRMIYRKAKPKSTLLKEFEEHVRYRSPQEFIDETLVPMAAIYREICEADCRWVEHRADINERLKWINRIGFKDWMPPALAFIDRHPNAPMAVLDFLGDLERLIYSMLVRKAGINERIERFSRLTAAVEAGEALDAEASPLQLSPGEIAATVAALDGPIYDTHSARACAIVLVRLDSLLSGGGATYDYPVITVEHVLPQQPQAESEWSTWFPQSEQQAYWLHRLGNLALLTRSKNAGARNYEFEKKKDICFRKAGASPFILTTQVLDKDVWTPDIVETRHQALLDIFRKHWRLDAAPTAP
jgi:hypothetical protein